MQHEFLKTLKSSALRLNPWTLSQSKGGLSPRKKPHQLLPKEAMLAGWAQWAMLASGAHPGESSTERSSLGPHSQAPKSVNSKTQLSLQKE